MDLNIYPFQQSAIESIWNIGRLSGWCSRTIVSMRTCIGSRTFIFLFTIVVINIWFVDGLRDIRLRH